MSRSGLRRSFLILSPCLSGFTAEGVSEVLWMTMTRS